MSKKNKNKWQFGDFQTPDLLALSITNLLKEQHNIQPDVVIEPSCGKGAFVKAALSTFTSAKIIAADINEEYIAYAKTAAHQYENYANASISALNFFETDWISIVREQPGYILIIGNPPWVTSSELSSLNSRNLPQKSNFQNRRGIEAITGSSNFDISEWMLLQYMEWLAERRGTVAVLCKYSVARKVIKQISRRSAKKISGSIYKIDANLHFSASVEACLLVLSSSNHSAEYSVYDCLNAIAPSRCIGIRSGLMISKLETYERLQHLEGRDLRYTWRSGIKHDCAKIMELEPHGHCFKNGLKEKHQLESDYLYPLLKSSDIGSGRVDTCRKIALVTQQKVGEDTDVIKIAAPDTWEYLLQHKSYLARRKSSVYKGKPEFSIFGVGDYTFKPWKIAISGLYKQLSFRLVGPIDDKPVVFDDTVNFLSFDSEAEARFVHSLLLSRPALDFLDSIIFWDEKRPITINLLKRLSIKLVAKELDVLDQYMLWATASFAQCDGQYSLGLAEPPGSYSIEEIASK